MSAFHRVGRKLGRTLYRDDVLIGIMDRPEDAAFVAHCLNTHFLLREALEIAEQQTSPVSKVGLRLVEIREALRSSAISFKEWWPQGFSDEGFRDD